MAGARVGRGSCTRSERLRDAVRGCSAYEETLGQRLLDGVRAIPALKLWGPSTMAGRVPTFGFTIADRTPQSVAAALAERDIFAWAGDFYAVEVIARLGLADQGGLLRLGLCHYNTLEEVDRALAALTEIVG